MNTPGQELALQQITRLANTTDTLELVSIVAPNAENPFLLVEVSIFTGDLPKSEGGLSLRARERFIIAIDPNFPYEYPVVRVPHTRFAGFPHVQWAKQLCLYQAPQVEWFPQRGMLGFFERLELWLRKAAVNELDPIEGALHPPVAYPAAGAPKIVVHANVPATSAESHWFGFADLAQKHEQRIDVVGWSGAQEEIAGLAAPCILLNVEMPFEFPKTVLDLVQSLRSRGVDYGDLIPLFKRAIAHNGIDQPLYVILGTPMRGVRGGERQQHLTGWEIDQAAVKLLDLDDKAVALGECAKELRDAIIELFIEWVCSAKVRWCRTLEDRSEIVQRRDSNTPMASFQGLTVELWGCGGLGSQIGEHLVRAGASSIVLVDEGIVTPGILVRQNFTDSDIGKPKSKALAERLRAINPNCQVAHEFRDVLQDQEGSSERDQSIDLIVDATASGIVLTKTEERWKEHPEDRRPIATVAVDANARRGMVILVQPDHSGGPLDVARRMKLATCSQPRLNEFRDAFFPDDPPAPFQPEPGCSQPTFIGSSVDTAYLAASMLNFVANEMNSEERPTAVGGFLPSSNARQCERLPFTTDVCIDDPQSGYQTRVTLAAWNSLQACTHESARIRGAEEETGGLLLGELDEYLKIVWVSEASGPPPDSTHSPELFLCGVEGTTELNDVRKHQTNGTVSYVGTWHIHPVSEPIPSARDYTAMNALFSEGLRPPEQLLLLIVGTPLNAPVATASVFERAEFDALRKQGWIQRRHSLVPVGPPLQRPRNIGLALSGGGSRAIAFHLGCLRALHDRGLLPAVDVLSTVSGGSVIGAMYVYSDDSFGKFDARVQEVLRQGFIRSIARYTFLSPLLLRIIATQLASALPAYATFGARQVVSFVERALSPSSRTSGSRASRIQPPFRRWASRTDAFAEALRAQVFGTTPLTGARRDAVNIVINACELRTGTAFRFGNRESGTWRFGTVEGNGPDVATAVAASAAYPAMLPALDRIYSFVNRKGERSDQRVILTDGGVYENLGVTALSPADKGGLGTNHYQPPYIICCDAGRGELDDTITPYGWGTRMSRSFETNHRQVQHGLQGQLHLWQQFGQLTGFIYSYLGQRDERLPYQPVDLVQREQVIHYPTDFSPMRQTDIDLLAARGYQLTRLLIEHYCPEL
jgi:predicted acylesterase/phospholipase RssA/molybdopterin/thiamine biosynthesis adenylyltransferase